MQEANTICKTKLTIKNVLEIISIDFYMEGIAERELELELETPTSSGLHRLIHYFQTLWFSRLFSIEYLGGEGTSYSSWFFRSLMQGREIL